MPLDGATYPAALDPTIPADGNFVYEGDDHIRTVKTVIKNAFPAIAGACGANEFDLPLGKKNATVAPTVNDDSGDGYSYGSIWVDRTGKKSYICVDPTPAAAIWNQIDLASQFVSGMKMMFFNSDTTIMTGWTFRTFDEDYVIAPGATNAKGGTNNGVTANNTGWAVSGLSGTQPNHTHADTFAISLAAHTFQADAAIDGTDAFYLIYSGTSAGHTHGLTGSVSADGNDAVTVSASGAWRPPTLYGTIWEKN